MHDHGLLIPPKETGDFALLVGCVQKAKQMSDEFLTQVMDEERQEVVSSSILHPKDELQTKHKKRCISNK